jgi:hypothetical protein
MIAPATLPGEGSGPAGGRPLLLSDREQIDRALSSCAEMAPSELSFANLYLFRDRHDYALVAEPVPHVTGTTYDGERHALPLVPVDAAIARALLGAGVDCVYPVGSEGPALAEEAGLGVRHVDADSDYWFDGQQLSSLVKAKQRRAQARSFEAEHAPRFEPWQAGLAGEALQVLDGWLADVGRTAEATDFDACREAIGLADAIGLEGGLVRIASGEPVAFVLASRRGDAVRILHFAKGRRAYSAAYPWMFSTYAQQCGARLFNFEQDLGNPGLAQSKRAYAPIARAPKYRLYRK